VGFDQAHPQEYLSDMIWYFGRRYTTKLTGSIRQRASCEKCGSAYTYLVTRQGLGQGTSPYMLDNAGAAERAREAAQRRLNDKLQKAIDPVPCPKCGWVQANMVEEARRRRLRWMRNVGIFLPILTLVPYGLIAAMMRADVNDFTMFVVMLAAIGFSLLPARALLNSCFNPND
jgi:hypothetical protein